MDLGVRQIRSAGRGSGSIELTLPAELRDLVGLQCRIMLRDGSRPDIVLQPDLRCAHQAFADLWHTMATALLHTDVDAPPLPLGAFSFGLQPRPGTGEMPFLSWRDGVALSAGAPHDPGVIARTVAAFAQAMATFLDIDASLAAGFGAASGYLVAGVPATPDGQEACDLAAAALRLAHRRSSTGKTMFLPPSAAVDACASGVLSVAFWCHAAPLLTAATDLFLDWTSNPSGHAALRAAWRRGRAIEMSGD
jgi:hypothetical protein